MIIRQAMPQDAAELAEFKKKNPDVPLRIVVLSDGGDTNSKTTVRECYHKLRKVSKMLDASRCVFMVAE